MIFIYTGLNLRIPLILKEIITMLSRPDKIADFSEASLGGLFLDMNAFIGDNLSFYLDHQFHETSPETAVEPRNIERHLRDAGVPIVGASPAVADITFIFKRYIN